MSLTIGMPMNVHVMTVALLRVNIMWTPYVEECPVCHGQALGCEHIIG